jgi:serine/threonine protein kinase/tetratricopeptide (TPR) repeat protein
VDPKRFEQIQAVFNQALKLRLAERPSFLSEACGSDLDLRRDVDALLAAHEDPVDLEPPAEQGSDSAQAEARQLLEQIREIGPTVEIPPPRRIAELETRPDRVGPYKILEQIGEGGMGTVYLAEQAEPIRRRVALKIIKLGMDTKQVIARFEIERQALAMMDHPNVAKVLDAGATSEGRPYFVMEHVQGERITDYCDRHRLTTKERLLLFMDVCHAVQHAHQKAIIHRDIKPSNILVTVKDGKLIAKVIDFGVAKATDHNLTEHTVFTEQGQLIGTPEYMSPEQAEMSALNVDTRTDIYSLGVVLYELLAGALPFDSKSLRRAAFNEIQRIIREIDPPNPSTRLSSLGDDSTTAAQKRRTDRAGLERQLRGDLDLITLKAMDKDRTRRYATALELSSDIKRHLDHEPVVATPPSAGYRASKFLRRNRGPVAALAAVVLALAIGMTVATIQYLRVAEQRQLTEKRTEELKILTEFQQSMLSDIDAEIMGRRIIAAQRENIREAMESRGGDPQQIEAALAAFDKLVIETNATDLALSVVNENVLARAVERIRLDFAANPILRAALEEAVASTYIDIGLYESALPLREASLRTRRDILGDEHRDTLQSMNNLGLLLQMLSRYEEALSRCREALEGRRRVFGGDDPDTLQSINNMGILLKALGKYQGAFPYQREALDGFRRVLGDDDPNTLTSLNNMGGLFMALGEYEEVLPYYRETLEGRRRVLGENHPHTVISINNMGRLLKAMGKFEEALPYHRRALAIRRRVLGDDHSHTLTSINNMGSLFRAMGKHEEALRYHREALEGRLRVLGEGNSSTLTSLFTMGAVLKDMGKYEEALPFYSKALEGRRRLLGDGHPGTLTSIDSMGSLLKHMGKHQKALPYYREALEGRHRNLGDDHPHTLSSLNNMGSLLKNMGKYEEALPYNRKALEGRRRNLGDDHPDTLTSINNMGILLRHMGKYEEGLIYYREALEGYRRGLGDDHPHTLTSLNNMGSLLKLMGKPEKALPYYREALKGRRRALGDDHPDTLTSNKHMGSLLMEMGEYEEAMTYYREALAGRRQVLGVDHPDTLQSINNMGILLRHMGKYEEALIHNSEALEGYRRGLGNDHPRTLRSISSMGSLLEAMGKPEEALSYYSEALEGRRRTLGDEHPDTLTATQQLGRLLRALGKT